MTVNSYLENLASSLVLKGDEKDSISTSISTIRTRLSSRFGSSVKERFQFGSSIRDTILPRKADEHSDIDYMVVFDTSSESYKPQTYLNQLRRFVEQYYSTSQIHQSHPTIVLELSHIKFELVPAIKPDLWSSYQIPSPSDSFLEWMNTDPTGFGKLLTDKNTNNSYRIKPLVRLVKYWNALNGRHFSSYDLENYIVNANYPFFLYSAPLKDYFYAFWDMFSYGSGTSQYVADKVDRAKEKIAEIKQDEENGYPSLAESNLQKILPSI